MELPKLRISSVGLFFKVLPHFRIWAFLFSWQETNPGSIRRLLVGLFFCFCPSFSFYKKSLATTFYNSGVPITRNRQTPGHVVCHLFQTKRQQAPRPGRSSVKLQIQAYLESRRCLFVLNLWDGLCLLMSQCVIPRYTLKFCLMTACSRSLSVTAA